MKSIIIFATFLLAYTSSAQTGQEQEVKFVEINHGVAEVVLGTTEVLKNSPTGNRGYLSGFAITKTTDSVHTELKANFGVEYMLVSKDTVDIEVVIEWIFPEKIKNDEGKKFKSLKYSTQRPTNIPTASSYSLDKNFELVKGEWKMNIYVKEKLLYSKTFILY